MTIGEIARRTGISVRTLHYYEQLGLLRPARRTAKGHRVYGDAELLRLQQILSLRALGIALAEVRDVLAKRSGALEVVERHLERVDAQIQDQHRLRTTLSAIARRLRDGKQPTAEMLLRAIEETTMIEKYFTPEQLEALKARRDATPDERMRSIAGDWQRTIAEVRTAMERGTDPSDPSLANVAERWVSLIREFSGGDRAIEAATAQMYRGEKDMRAQYGLEPDLQEYVGRMLRAHGHTIGGMA